MVMTTSPEFTNDSSFDWSASYRFNIQGLTAVCPLPGQPKVAFPNASLGGTNFQSHPHGQQAGPYHSRGILPTLQARQQRVRTGYPAQPVPHSVTRRETFQHVAQQTHHREIRRSPDPPPPEEDREQHLANLRRIRDNVNRWRVEVELPDRLPSRTDALRRDMRDSASDGDSDHSESIVNLPIGVPSFRPMRHMPTDQPKVQAPSEKAAKAKKSSGSSNSVFDFDPAPVNLIAQAQRVNAATPGEVQLAHPTDPSVASEPMIGPSTPSPSNKSENRSSCSSHSSLSPIVLEARLDAPKVASGPGISSGRDNKEAAQSASDPGGATSSYKSASTSVKHATLGGTQSIQQTRTQEDRLSVPVSVEDRERLQMRRIQIRPSSDPSVEPLDVVNDTEIDIGSDLGKDATKAAPSVVSSASSGAQAGPSRMETSRPLSSASLSASEAASEAHAPMPAGPGAHYSPKQFNDETAPKQPAIVTEQAPSLVRRTQPVGRTTPFLERPPSILRNSSYMNEPYQQINPRKSVTFQEHLTVLPEGSVSSVNTTAHSEKVAGPDVMRGSPNSASLHSSGFSKRRQLDEEDLNTESSEDDEGPPKIKSNAKHSFDPRPVELVARPVSEGSIGSSQRAESKVLPRSSTGSEESESQKKGVSAKAKKKEEKGQTEERNHSHGLPSDFYQPKRPLPKKPQTKSETANPYRATVEEDPEEPFIPQAERPRRQAKPELPHKKPPPLKSSSNLNDPVIGRDSARLNPEQTSASIKDSRNEVNPQQPPEQKNQPTKQKDTVPDPVTGKMCVRLHYPSSGLVMPDLPDKPIARHTLGCSSVTMALHGCRGSSVYKDMRNTVWRFHLDLEDLNKRRQRQWQPLSEQCRDLMARAMTDLSKAYVFRDRWERGRYRHFLGSVDGSEEGTIFYMFKASLAWIRLGSRYAFEAQRELQRISDQSNEQIQALNTSNTYIPVALFDQKRVIASVLRIDQYFKNLAKDTEYIEILLRQGLYQLEKAEIGRMLRKGADRPTPEQLREDAMLRSDLIAWFDQFLANVLRQWEKSLSDSAFEDSLKRFRNYDREWEEEGPNFGLLRSKFCLGICLPRQYRTKLVNWHFVDNEPKVENETTVAIEEDSDGEGAKRAPGQTRKLGRQRRMLNKTLEVVERIAEKFAQKEDMPDEASQCSSDEEAASTPAKPAATRYTPPVQTTRRLTQTQTQSQSQGDRMSSRDTSSEKSRRGSVHDALGRSVAPVDKKLLRYAENLLLNILHEPYRDECLRAIEALMSLISEGGTLPGQMEIDESLKLPRKLKPQKAQSMLYEEWANLKKFVTDFLAAGGFTKRELWQIYLRALEDWNMDYTTADEEFEDLCTDDEFLASLDEPLNWPAGDFDNGSAGVL